MSDTEVIEVEEVGTEIVVRDTHAPATLFRTDDPVEVVGRASATADALTQAIRTHDRDKSPDKRLISSISGKEYPKVECWTLLGTMLGVFPKVAWTNKLADGWEARVEAVTRDGAVIGAAEAMCTRSESNWKSRPDNALRSMAQTRATSKALRGPLGFVMTLAGLEATPSEEMPGNNPSSGGDEKTTADPVQAGGEKAEGSPGVKQKPEPGSQWGKDVKNIHRMHRMLEAQGLSDEQYRAQIKENYGTEHVSELTERQAADLVKRLRSACEQLGVE